MRQLPQLLPGERAILVLVERVKEPDHPAKLWLSDREAALDLGLLTDGGILLGDYAYGGNETVALLTGEAELLMITRRQAPERKRLLSSIRQRIGTYLGQLCHLFVDTIYSRSWRGLWSTVKLKLLAYHLRHSGLVSF